MHIAGQAFAIGIPVLLLSLWIIVIGLVNYFSPYPVESTGRKDCSKVPFTSHTTHQINEGEQLEQATKLSSLEDLVNLTLSHNVNVMVAIRHEEISIH